MPGFSESLNKSVLNQLISPEGKTIALCAGKLMKSEDTTLTLPVLWEAQWADTSRLCPSCFSTASLIGLFLSPGVLTSSDTKCQHTCLPSPHFVEYIRNSYFLHVLPIHLQQMKEKELFESSNNAIYLEPATINYIHIVTSLNLGVSDLTKSSKKS